MTQSQEPILLLSGAGLPAWIWDQVREELAPAHRTVVAGRPRHDRASLTEYAAAALDSAPWERFAVVAHSSGGTVAAEIVTLAPDRVAAFLAVTAVVPKPGRSFVASMPLPNRLVLSLAMRLAGTRPPDAAIRRGVASRVDPETADRIVAEFSPESVRLYRDAPRGGRFPERRGYLSTSQDAGLPSGLQQRFARNLDPSWHESVDSGHLPMLEAPDALARRIERFLTNGPG
ncbi:MULTISPECIES: alpha/beta fold hydrolase [Micromonospora]|nr:MULTISPECIES: alpha/beta hydrolase [Micromonospora]NES16882.1 alpha/beta hydrolase [Micromonospora sp. PPF5-17B]NES39155.1 alpha/beta hydrolase [Micromonospora solifontis]NES58909.1 alpha/beta hydrolase [Micromonospora sp. PPF5-6]